MRNINIFFDKMKFGDISEAILTGLNSKIRECDTVHMFEVNMTRRE